MAIPTASEVRARGREVTPARGEIDGNVIVSWAATEILLCEDEALVVVSSRGLPEVHIFDDESGFQRFVQDMNSDELYWYLEFYAVSKALLRDDSVSSGARSRAEEAALIVATTCMTSVP
jgi:hypothetical protein